jgi:hypothetical protein
VSKAIESRIAISGLIPARPLRMAERVFRLTPSPLAAAVTDIPKGSRHNSLTLTVSGGVEGKALYSPYTLTHFKSRIASYIQVIRSQLKGQFLVQKWFNILCNSTQMRLHILLLIQCICEENDVQIKNQKIKVSQFTQRQ